MQTKDLKVYQDTVEFCKVLHRLTRNFPRFEKYSIGGKLFNDSLDLIQLIAHANRDIAKREQWLTEYLVRFESIKSLLRICLNEVEDKESEAEHAVQQLNSYLGFLKHRRTYKYRRQCINALDPTWYEYFYIVGDCDKLKLKAKYTPKVKLRNILNLLTSNINKHGKNNDSKDRLCAMRQSRREHLQSDVPSGGR